MVNLEEKSLVTEEEISSINVSSIENLKQIEVDIPENRYHANKFDYSRKQCSPGDLLVSSAWRTY